MAIMKKGTNVGLDKNFQNVKVGDLIADFEGTIYAIDKYGHAVRKEDGASFDLNKITPFELYLPEPVTPEPEQPQEEPAPKELDPGLLSGFNPGDTSVHDAPDKMLAEELRHRGYEVKATKTITVEI